MSESLASQPDNIDNLNPTSYKLNFKRLPATTFNIKSVSLPALSTEAVPRYTSFGIDWHPGDTISYDDLECTFLVDEDLVNWLEIHDWMRHNASPEKYPDEAITNAFRRSDCSLTLLTNKKNANLRIQFIDAFPTSLGNIEFVANESGVLTAQVTFKYSYYKIEKLV